MAIRIAGEEQIAPREGVLDRVSARLRSRQLDEALARGVPPETSARLALRARRLTALSRRRAIADALRRVMRVTCRGVPRPRPGSRLAYARSLPQATSSSGSPTASRAPAR